VNQNEDAICATADTARLTAIQMHGDNEDPHVADLVVARQPLKVLAGISMRRSRPEGWAMMWDQANVYAFLADSGNSPQLGGTGQSFDWKESKAALNTIRTLGRLVLAGGLNPSNVASACELTGPWGVDISSGVESRPGKKDPDKVRAFIYAVHEADKLNSRN
jgi:phosphoribosylanthranilate isomerase